MSEWKNEQEARNKIKNLVAEYYHDRILQGLGKGLCLSARGG